MELAPKTGHAHASYDSNENEHGSICTRCGAEENVDGPQITQQPADYVGVVGDTATFTFVAEGEGLKYQWYASSDGGATWTASYLTGYNTDNFSSTVTAARAAKL